MKLKLDQRISLLLCNTEQSKKSFVLECLIMIMLLLAPWKETTILEEVIIFIVLWN